MSEQRVDNLRRGVLEGVKIVTQFIRSRVIPLCSTLNSTTDDDVRLLGAYQRVFNWMQSLEKLQSPADYQAVVTANRALFELTIDLILVLNGGPNYSVERMYWWEQSVKLKAAKALVKYFADKSQSVPDNHKANEDFIERQGDEIIRRRQLFWPGKKGKGFHPPRWTGDNLATDAKKADKLLEPEYSTDLGKTLEEFHDTQILRMHLSVHGSALAIEMYSEPLTIRIICAIAYEWSSDLALLCTKLIITKLGILEKIPELSKEIEQVMQLRRDANEHF